MKAEKEPGTLDTARIPSLCVITHLFSDQRS